VRRSGGTRHAKKSTPANPTTRQLTYCVDLRVTNHTTVEQAWRATFALNGTRISSTSNLTLDTNANGIVRLVPNQAIPGSTSQQGLFGFCVSRPSGGAAMPGAPLVRTQY